MVKNQTPVCVDIQSLVRSSHEHMELRDVDFPPRTHTKNDNSHDLQL